MRLRDLISNDYRNPRATDAFRRVFCSPTARYVSIGGGPNRPSSWLINVNIAREANVDVLGDVYALPFADASVDALYCEALLEHLREPARAIGEMSRVLKPGGLVYAVTPFLQPYHGYPDHFQNYTLLGHEELFRAGAFAVEESGACVGAAVMVCDMVTAVIDTHVPGLFRFPVRWGWLLFGAAIRPLDRFFNRSADGHVLASTTFVVARKG